MSKLYFLLFIVNVNFVNEPPSINELRILYQRAATNKIYCKELIERLATCDKNDHPLHFGYKGVATMMMAQYVSNPFTKLAYFEKGKRMLEIAIATDKNNAELRFLRLATQIKAPSFLGYKDHIQSDKSFLLGAVGKLSDVSLKRDIVSYLNGCNCLNAKMGNKN